METITAFHWKIMGKNAPESIPDKLHYEMETSSAFLTFTHSSYDKLSDTLNNPSDTARMPGEGDLVGGKTHQFVQFFLTNTDRCQVYQWHWGYHPGWFVSSLPEPLPCHPQSLEVAAQGPEESSYGRSHM